MVNVRVERVRGANDVLPEDYEGIKAIENELKTCFASYGYRPIDVPVIEYTDLHLRKSGEELISRLYDFTFQGRRLCLRPEMTASVIRAYVENLQEAPLPIRLYYAGPVFRYEKPGRGRYRQFTQMGVEVIGAAGPAADAEVLQLACQGLTRLGLKQYHAVIGHIGILVDFLNSLALEGRIARFLIAHMETLRKEGRQTVADRLAEIYPAFSGQGRTTPADRPEPAPLPHLRSAAEDTDGSLELIEAMDRTEAHTVVLGLLEGMAIKLDSVRDPQEIVDRLLAKMKRKDQSPQLRQALMFMHELGQLAGEPLAVLREAERLLAAYAVDRSPLDHLRATIEYLACYELDRKHVELDLGLTRGVHYYTGMVFEIEHGSTGEERQLAGGGRYDGLVAALGGRQDTPAVGFSYGLERLLHALAAEKIRHAHGAAAVADALVSPVSAHDIPYAIQVAEHLRRLGLAVELEIRERSIAGSLRYADKRQIPFAVVVGPEERATSVVVLKEMASRTSQRLGISDAASHIRAARSRS